jgi:hypothetical protein
LFSCIWRFRLCFTTKMILVTVKTKNTSATFCHEQKIFSANLYTYIGLRHTKYIFRPKLYLCIPKEPGFFYMYIVYYCRISLRLKFMPRPLVHCRVVSITVYEMYQSPHVTGLRKMQARKVVQWRKKIYLFCFWALRY